MIQTINIQQLLELKLSGMFSNTGCLSFVQVAVHSGGKHCLALTSNEEVYAWGDGEDGKLGLGHKK